MNEKACQMCIQIGRAIEQLRADDEADLASDLEENTILYFAELDKYKPPLAPVPPATVPS